MYVTCLIRNGRFFKNSPAPDRGMFQQKNSRSGIQFFRKSTMFLALIFDTKYVGKQFVGQLDV